MKLLLTSVGLSSEKISQTFLRLLPKNPGEAKVAFVPTAAVTENEKNNVKRAEEDLFSVGIKKENIQTINLDHEITYDEIGDCDAMYVCGGNTFYLLDAIRKSNFQAVAKEFILHEKVYVGESAGSIVLTPTIAIAGVEPADSNDVGLTDFTAMSIVDFEVSPHVPEVVTYESVEEYSKTTKRNLYAFDHNCALLLKDGVISFVGDGRHKEYN